MTFEGVVLFTTGKAIAFQSHYWDSFLFLPMSQITIEQEDSGFSYVVHVKDWLAKKRNLMEFTHYSAEQIEEIAAT